MNRTVARIVRAIFFSDASHEISTVVLSLDFTAHGQKQSWDFPGHLMTCTTTVGLAGDWWPLRLPSPESCNPKAA